MTDVATSTPEQTLAWEAERRPMAAAAAALAGILTLGGGVFSQVGIFADYPSVGPLQALRPALTGRAELLPNPRTPGILFLDDHAASLIIAATIISLGSLFIGYVLSYLFTATAARRPQLPRAARWVAIAGPVGVAVLGLLRQILTSSNAHHFAGLATDQRTHDAVVDVQGSGALVVVNGLALAGQLAIGFAFVLICLNAMRAGLLTRFMGVLGIIVGVLFVLPLGSPLPIVQSFWLIALTPLFLLRTPNGGPPAWRTGKAEPWPTQQQLREAREAETAGAGGEPGGGPAPAASRTAPDAGDEPDVPTTRAHPSSKKRKRRR